MSQDIQKHSPNLPLMDKRIPKILGKVIIIKDTRELRWFSKKRYKAISKFKTTKLWFHLEQKSLIQICKLLKKEQKRNFFHFKELFYSNLQVKQFVSRCQNFRISQAFSYFNMQYHVPVKGQCLKDLYKRLSTFRSLSTFRLFFIHRAVSQEEINSLASSLKPLTQLTKLSLTWLASELLTDQTLTCFFASLKYLKLLKTFKLKFEEFNKLTSQEATALFSSLQQMPFLESLKVKLSSSRLNQVLQQNSFHFLANIPTLHSLKQLSLEFERYQSMDQAMHSLSLSLMRLSHIIHLNIKLTKRLDITDAGMLNLIKGLEFLEQLRDLSLSFPCCNAITDKGIFILGQDLRKKSLLKSLQLNFCLCNLMTDSGIVDAFKGLLELEKIDSLCLKFGSPRRRLTLCSLQDLRDFCQQSRCTCNLF